MSLLEPFIVAGLDIASLRARFTFRHYQGLDDIGAMRAVHDACRVHDQIDPYSVCYSIPNLPVDAYARLVQAAPPQATLLAVEEGQVVAHAWMEAWGHEERAYLWHVWVMPHVRGLGLGTAMHRWGEVRARGLHRGDPHPALHLANATEGEQDAVALLYNEGYHLSFVSPELVFDDFDALPPVPSVAGLTFRNLEPSAHRAVARALGEANLNPPEQGGRWQGEELERQLDLVEAEWLERVQSAEPSLSPVAWEGNVVVGGYLCRRSGQVGEIAQVAVRESLRGLGVAQALAARSLSALKASGCVTARLYTSIGPDEAETGPWPLCHVPQIRVPTEGSPSAVSQDNAIIDLIVFAPPHQSETMLCCIKE